RRALGRLALAAACGLAACSLPPEAYDTAPSEAPTVGLAATDSTVRTIQLHITGEEASLPVLSLRGAQTLTLAFDRLVDDGGRPLEVSFQHTTREGRPDLLPTEFLTGFERDDITDYRASGATAVPYVHYEYSFPNALVGFKLSGAYRLRVAERGGATLFERVFYVSEEQAEVDLAFGATLAGGDVGLSVQPAARVRPRAALTDFDAFQYTVCFARDGRVDAPRCAPEPRLVDLALYQFYLPADQAFPPQGPLFEFDLGLLASNEQVVETDRTARPPTALLDLDYADFGGDVRDAVLAVPLVEAVYRDGGDAETEAEYVDVRFRYVPEGQRESPRPVYVRGTFNGWRTGPDVLMEWQPDGRRYERTVRIKQGAYVYGYSSPGGPPRRQVALGQANLYTAFVYLADPQRFTDRLVAVQSSLQQ
ncbi:MAG TPA: type IX secretion system plug protein domain-containing protein, partial [Rubricoccaceae bacterium]